MIPNSCKNHQKICQQIIKHDSEIIKKVIAKLLVAQGSASLTGPTSLITGATAPDGGRTAGALGTGGVTGVVHSRIDTGITGPSGASSDASDYDPTTTIYVWGGITGDTIDIFGDIIDG